MKWPIPVELLHTLDLTETIHCKLQKISDEIVLFLREVHRLLQAAPISEGRSNMPRVKTASFVLRFLQCRAIVCCQSGDPAVISLFFSSSPCPSFLSKWLIWQLSVLSANVGVAILSPGGLFLHTLVSIPVAGPFPNAFLLHLFSPPEQPTCSVSWQKGDFSCSGQVFMAWVIAYILRPLC